MPAHGGYMDIVPQAEHGAGKSHKTSSGAHPKYAWVCRINHRAMDWLDRKHYSPLDWTISMIDSATTNGWLRKSNFPDDSEEENEQHLACKIQLAREHSLRLLGNYIKDYSQLFEGKANQVSDSLSRDFYLNDKEQTQLLTTCVSSQFSPSFSIAPLPQEIVSFFSVWRLKMPARSPLR